MKKIKILVRNILMPKTTNNEIPRILGDAQKK